MPWSGRCPVTHSAASAGSLGGARRSHVDLPDLVLDPPKENQYSTISDPTPPGAHSRAIPSPAQDPRPTGRGQGWPEASRNYAKQCRVVKEWSGWSRFVTAWRV